MPLWQLEFANHNSQRSYPFVAGTSKTDRTGSVTLPNEFVLGFKFPVSAGLAIEPEKFFLRALGLYTTGYTLEFGYSDGSTDGVAVAVTQFARDTHVENRIYAVLGVDDFADSVGSIMIGRLEAINTLPAGVYRFAPAASFLEVDGIQPSLRGLASIAVVNGSDHSARLYGDVELVAQQNMRLTLAQSGETTQILVSAISGEGLNESCVCAEAEALGPPIRFINGISPQADGNFGVTGDGCTEITAISNGLAWRDVCSAPCCGSAELAAMREQLQRFAIGFSQLETLAQVLSGQVTQMTTMVLGSKLSDQGCTNC